MHRIAILLVVGCGSAAESTEEAAALSLDSITPSAGPVAGGTEVTLNGSGFEKYTTVLFGDVPVDDIVVVSTERLTATAPPVAEAAEVDVTTSNSTGETATLKAAFRYTDTVGWCNLQWPKSTAVGANSTTETIYGRVYKENVTVGAGQGAGIQAEVGYGAAFSPPSSDDWSWFAASYNVDVDSGITPGDLANDEYMGTLTPDKPGNYAYAYRMSADSGGSWLYCDNDQEGSDNGFSIDSAGSLTVQ